MNPAIAHFEALFAALRTRCDIAYLVEMCTLFRHKHAPLLCGTRSQEKHFTFASQSTLIIHHWCLSDARKWRDLRQQYAAVCPARRHLLSAYLAEQHLYPLLPGRYDAVLRPASLRTSSGWIRTQWVESVRFRSHWGRPLAERRYVLALLVPL